MSGQDLSTTRQSTEKLEATRQLPKDRSVEAVPTSPMAVLAMQALAGNGAVARLLSTRGGRLPPLQRVSINPAAFFGAPRADNDVDSTVSANQLRGHGAEVNARRWHTQLNFSPLHQPGPHPAGAMHAEGSGVTGVIGPDHSYGSQPASLTAMHNNLIAGNIRGMVPHGHVAAHIVNDQLGGPGESQNLFAFPGPANTLMETQVENNMKAAVAAGNFIYYSAQVNHPAAGPANSITMSWNKLDDAGNDIGGGQANAVITAAQVATNTAHLVQGAGTVARRGSLRHPTDPTVIKNTPWGPFQMPDPKNYIALQEYLDWTEFPAVGRKRAFEAFLTTHKSNPVMLQLLLGTFNDATFFSGLGMWIASPKSTIQLKSRRGITAGMVKDLRTGTTSKREAAFIAIMDTGDAPRVIGAAGALFAKAARTSARGRV